MTVIDAPILGAISGRTGRFYDAEMLRATSARHARNLRDWDRHQVTVAAVRRQVEIEQRVIESAT